MNPLSRRGFLAASAAAFATIHLPRAVMAQAAAPLACRIDVIEGRGRRLRSEAERVRIAAVA